MMAPVAALAEQIRNDRRPVTADNPFIALQESASRQNVTSQPTLQAAVGIDPAGP